MITVVFLFQSFHCFLITHAKIVSQLPDRGVEDGEKFFFSNAAQRFVTPVHTDVIRLVESAEHAHLRELGDSGEHHKLQVLVGILEQTVESFQKIAVVVF